MTNGTRDDPPRPTDRIGEGYVARQLAKALEIVHRSDDVESRDRAVAKIARWRRVLAGIRSGETFTGSRAPLRDVPAWVTTEVVTGGFVTGTLSAGGPLQPHELALSETLSGLAPSDERGALTAWYLTEEGQSSLRTALRERRYEIRVPEEGALLTWVWLLDNGRELEASELFETLQPWFGTLRFYPAPAASTPDTRTTRVRTVGELRDRLSGMEPQAAIVAQKRAVDLWLPLHDETVALWLETRVDGVPARHFPDDWQRRATSLLARTAEARRAHPPSRRHDRPTGHRSLLRALLEQAARDPGSIADGQARQVRHVLDRFVARRGAPGSPECETSRAAQRRDVEAPLHGDIAGVLAARLVEVPVERGLDDPDTVLHSVTPDEADRHAVPAGTDAPPAIASAVGRALEAPLETLVERGIVTSGETIARLLTTLSSEAIAGAIEDPTLAHLHAAIYRAFRRRRSVLLLNLESQVRLEELPWVRATRSARASGTPGTGAPSRVAGDLLDRTVTLAIDLAPHVIVPNPLITEFASLARAAGRTLPLVPELAADIFEGAFSTPFVTATRRTAAALDGSTYARYYGIDYAAVDERLRDDDRAPAEFAMLCHERAELPDGTSGRSVARNATIIEQQMILTTQNLTALVAHGGPDEPSAMQLEHRADRCLDWILARLHDLHPNRFYAAAEIRACAYAWRQMVYYLSLLPDEVASRFVGRAVRRLDERSGASAARIAASLLDGLTAAIRDEAPTTRPSTEGHPFIGCTVRPHWILDAMGHATR